jgi:hypothetical protein
VTALVERIAEGKRRKEGRSGKAPSQINTEQIIAKEMERANPPSSNYLAQQHLGMQY